MRGVPKKIARLASAEAITAEISRLAAMPLAELKAAWCGEFRRDPPKGLFGRAK
jgi:hypothetical protein